MSTQGSQNVHRSYQDTINEPINDPINNTGVRKKQVSKFNPETVDLTEYVDREVWFAYCRMRKAKRAEIKTENTVELCLNTIKRLSGGDSMLAKAILNQSIQNCYTGLFELKNQQAQKTFNDEPEVPWWKGRTIEIRR